MEALNNGFFSLLDVFVCELLVHATREKFLLLLLFSNGSNLRQKHTLMKCVCLLGHHTNSANKTYEDRHHWPDGHCACLSRLSVVDVDAVVVVVVLLLLLLLLLNHCCATLLHANNSQCCLCPLNLNFFLF